MSSSMRHSEEKAMETKLNRITEGWHGRTAFLHPLVTRNYSGGLFQAVPSIQWPCY